METLQQQNIELKAELDNMKTMMAEIKEELKDLKANHCKINENCEKREQKVTTLQDKQLSIAGETNKWLNILSKNQVVNQRRAVRPEKEC